MTKQKQEWEDKFDKEFPMTYFWSIGAGKNEHKDNYQTAKEELKSFISQEIEKAYQKGKEEALKLSVKVMDINDDEHVQEINEARGLQRKQTIEEVEKMIKGIDFMKLYLEYKNNPAYTITDEIMWSMKVDILQQLNKMKEYEKT